MAALRTYSREESVASETNYVFVDTGRARQARADLYPPGRAYAAASSEGTNMYAFNEGLATNTERLEYDVRRALDAIDPRQAYAYLDDWETALDLPDTAFASIDPHDRRLAAYQKLVGPGGQSPDFLISVAADLGYYIEVEHNYRDDSAHTGNYTSSAMCGRNRCGSGDLGHYLTIHVRGAGDDPQLEAAIKRYLHPHALVTFAYDL